MKYIFFQKKILSSACICNNQGSTKTDGSNCTTKCCDDDGSCKCKSGYGGEACNKCLPGYHVSAIINSEVTCEGLYSLSISQQILLHKLPLKFDFLLLLLNEFQLNFSIPDIQSTVLVWIYM